MVSDTMHGIWVLPNYITNHSLFTAISVNVTGSRSEIRENEGMVSDAVIVSLHGEAEQELTLQVTYLGAAQIGKRHTLLVWV